MNNDQQVDLYCLHAGVHFEWWYCVWWVRCSTQPGNRFVLQYEFTLHVCWHVNICLPIVNKELIIQIFNQKGAKLVTLKIMTGGSHDWQ